jgi:hypothetical protein
MESADPAREDPEEAPKGEEGRHSDSESETAAPEEEVKEAEANVQGNDQSNDGRREYGQAPISRVKATKLSTPPITPPSTGTGPTPIPKVPRRPKKG